MILGKFPISVQLSPMQVGPLPDKSQRSGRQVPRQHIAYRRLHPPAWRRSAFGRWFYSGVFVRMGDRLGAGVDLRQLGLH